MNNSTVNYKVLIPFAVFSVFIGFLSSVNPDLAAIIATTVIILSVFLGVYFPLGFYVCSLVMNIGFSPIHSSILAAVTGVVCIYILQKNYYLYQTRSSYFQLFFCFIAILILSFFGGINSTFMSAVTTLYTLMVGFTVGCYLPNKKESFISYPLFFGGIVVMYLVYYSLRTGSAIEFDATEGRLRYGDSVRILANALAFPVYYCFCKTLENIQQGKFVKNIIWLIIALASFYFLILTVSRGVIFAVIIAMIYVYFKRFRIKKGNNIFLILLAVAAFYFISTIDYNQGYMLNGLDTMTGRNEIWGYYFNRMQDSGVLTLLFGFGPGDVSRLSASSSIEGAYAHSLILDYFFRFGLFGFIFLASFVSYIGYKLINIKSTYYVGLLIMTVLMFISHGSVTTPLFYYLLGLCIGRSLLPKVTSNTLLDA